MTENFITQLFIPLVVGFAGGWASHYFAERRDLVSTRRNMRVSYLLEAYRRLENASNREFSPAVWEKFETAIADIQLLGTPKQVKLARTFAKEMAANSTASLDELTFDLRQSLRQELKLEPISDSVLYLRMNNRIVPHNTENT